MSGQINEIPEGAVLGDEGDDGDEGMDDEEGQGGLPSMAGLGQYNLDPATLA
jgi:hypothetical protein